MNRINLISSVYYAAAAENQDVDPSFLQSSSLIFDLIGLT